MVESQCYNKISVLLPVLGSPLGCFLIYLSRLFIPPRLSDEHSTRLWGSYVVAVHGTPYAIMTVCLWQSEPSAQTFAVAARLAGTLHAPPFLHGFVAHSPMAHVLPAQPSWQVHVNLLPYKDLSERESVHVPCVPHGFCVQGATLLHSGPPQPSLQSQSGGEVLSSERVSVGSQSV